MSATRTRQGPPTAEQPRSTYARWVAPGALSIGIVAACALLLLRSPHVVGSYGICPSAMLGLACPGCGGLRGTAELLHGDVAAAWALNPLAVLALPAALALAMRWWSDARADRPPWSPSIRLVLLLGGAIVAFGVARNVPMWQGALGPLALVALR